ncbi:MAG: nitronate monooxygenase [Hyphomicrobiaceae bacterium]
MALSTRLTERLGIKHPIISAPMAMAAGGRLAAAVSGAGAFGFIGGGYGDATWLETQFREAGNAQVGCGFITWSLRNKPELLTQVLDKKPRAVFLSFDDPEPFASEVRASGAVLMCQVQTLRDAQRALDVGADVVVAQGAEAGGHGAKRATITLVPEIVDLVRRVKSEALVCAAGGIADGRGLAAALMLGADGVVVGSRFWASREALVHKTLHDVALIATGDDTVRQSVTDIVRGHAWPEPYDIRVVRNAYVNDWVGRERELRQVAAVERERYAAALIEADATVAAAIAGEATGLIHDIVPAAEIVERMIAEAVVAMQSGVRHIG